MIFRIRAEKRGGHVHATFFVAPSERQTFASCGTLVFREEEWPVAEAAFLQMTGASASFGTIDNVDIRKEGFGDGE